jgi:hypothetical protein
MDILQSIIIRLESFSNKKEKKYRMKYLDFRHKSRITGDTHLNEQQERAVYSFWDNYFHIRLSAHEFYLEKTGVFDPRFIPDSVHFRIIDRYLNNWAAAKWIDNKCYYPRIFSGCKMPEILAYRLNGFWYDGMGYGENKEVIMEKVLASGSCFVKKATDSYGGKGVFFFDCKTKNKKDFEELINSITSDIVIQKTLEQSSIMSKLNPSSVNTIRIITLLKKNGTVKPYSTIVRMGVGGSKVDNASSGGITCGVNDDGRLKAVAYNVKGECFKEHPDTHQKFGEIVIQCYEKCKELVVGLHPQIPHFRLVSWDLAIDQDNEPVLIEANLCDGEIDFHQLNNGPLFKEDTKAILDEVFSKK